MMSSKLKLDLGLMHQRPANTFASKRGYKLFLRLQDKLMGDRASTLKLVLRWTLLLGIFLYLAIKLYTIGWGNIIQALPTSPLFYLLSLVFVSLPILTERLAFQIAAKTKDTPSLRVFTRKHVINKAVMNYAGEGYFIQQIARLKEQNLRRASIIVKDLTLIRTFSANFWVILLMVTALIFGKSDLLAKIIDVSPLMAVAIIASTIGICLAGIVFFQKLTRLKLSQAGKIAALYVIRSFLAACVLVAQWSLALPGTALATWLLFLVVFFVARKSPIGGDLVFISVALTLPGLNEGATDVAAMLIMMTAVTQIIYSSGFFLTSEFKPRVQNRTAPARA